MVMIMKIKRFLIILLLGVLTFFITSCDYVITLTPPETTTLETYIYPTALNGTYTFEDSSYLDFPEYVSPTYSLTDVSAYNDVLLATQDYIRHANIEVYTTLSEEQFSFPWSNVPTEVDVATSQGSGFIFKEDDISYYAITNYHVINPNGYNARYEVKAYGDKYYTEATVIAGDEDLDLAVIKFDKLYREDVTLINIEARLFYSFTPGELVMAIGNPLNLDNNVTFGEFISMESIDNVDYDVIHHNASIHEGSSGGALVDVDGNLLGVNAWGANSVDSESFAIPNYIVYIFLKNNGILD